MSVWRDRVKALIAELVQDLPADATLAERRKALSGKGYPAHGGTAWGRKMWGQEVRRYLERYHPEYCRKAVPDGFQWPDHIHFPFRQPASAQPEASDA